MITYGIKPLQALIVLILLLSMCRCGSPLSSSDRSPCLLTVVDVGQGLSQITSRSNQAVLWDVGSAAAATSVRSSLKRHGNPFIRALVISHLHEDHAGGLGVLDSTEDFSGLVIVNPYIDTAILRLMAGAWAKRLQFRVVSAPETLCLLDDVTISCFWPPKDTAGMGISAENQANQLSSCFRVQYGKSSVLITADIDSGVMRQLSRNYNWGLQSNLIVVPHHGSAGSVDPVFYGYVNPSHALISCAKVNSYNHPSATLLELFFQMHLPWVSTYAAGTIHARSNREYWELE